MNKHTPGPWTQWAALSSDIYNIRYIDGDNSEPVATIRHPVNMHQSEALANARLIAAAPELLEACEAVLSALNSHQAYDKDMRPLLRSVITKAKGES